MMSLFAYATIFQANMVHNFFFFHDVTETQKLLEGSHFYFNLPVCMEVIKPFNLLILPSHFFFFAIIGSNC